MENPGAQRLINDRAIDVACGCGKMHTHAIHKCQACGTVSSRMTNYYMGIPLSVALTLVDFEDEDGRALKDR